MGNISTQVTNRQVKVPFHGAELYVVEHNGQPYTPMKPIVEGMGLDWGGQHKKLAANEDRWGCISVTGIQLPGDTQRRDVVCLPLRKLGGWLMTVHASRVRPEIRDRIVQYQNECDDVLWQYWNDGIAVNPRIAFSVNPGDVLTGDQQETLRLMVKTLVERLPKAKQGGAATRVWSKLKAHFKVPYRQIPQGEFAEAVSIVTRTAAEWDVPTATVETDAGDATEMARELLENTHWHFTVQNGNLVLIPIDRGTFIATSESLASIIGRPNGVVPIECIPQIIGAAAGRLGVGALPAPPAH